MASVEKNLDVSGIQGLSEAGIPQYQWRTVKLTLGMTELILAECPICLALTLESVIMIHIEREHGKVMVQNASSADQG